MRVLNVGGGNRDLPAHYAGWDQVLLDVNPDVQPDLCMDALELDRCDERFDAVYCSHTLEHFYRHDVPKVLGGFLHVLVPGGFADIAVPNLRNLMESVIDRNLDIEDAWYRAGPNAISFHDVLYGWNGAMEKGNLFYAHRCGFTPLSLHGALSRAGFSKTEVRDHGMNITARAYKG